MRCLRSLLALTGSLILSSSLVAQTPRNLPRINTPVDETSLLPLKGNVTGLARAEFDQGEAPSSAQLSHVRLMLARTRAQQAALDQYDAELLDKSSPNYHKWLTPEQFGALYGPADSDIAAITAWLQSHGLQLDPPDPARTNISFSGSVAQIEELLHTSIHSFNINGEQFLSNAINPAIPAALAPVVSGVARLNTLQPRPHHVMGQMGTYDRDAGRMKIAPAASQSRPRPNLTGGSGTSSDPFVLYVVPGDAATIYNSPNSLNPSYSGTKYDGTGVTIGIGGDAVIKASTVLSYRQRYISSTDNNPPTITNVDNTTSKSDADEAYLDTEVSGGLAPGAKLHFYTGSTIDVGIQKMLTDNSVDIFSLSFGYCEIGYSTSDHALISGWWQQAATQGIAVVVSTGDNGAAGCDDFTSQTTAISGFAVSGWASSPYNLAVGGTDFGPLLSSFTTYVNPSSSNSAASLYRTALGPIPEWTWNDSTTINTTYSANIPFKDSQGNSNIVAGSGGVSSCSTNSDTSSVLGACQGGYAKPAWQRGTGVPSDGARDLPDVSLMAGAGGDAAAWLLCSDDQGTVSGVTVTADCSQQSDGHFYFFGIGGTSASTPAFAGILALVQQKAGGRLGQAAPGLYDLYNGANSAAVFHDITTGNISVPCSSGTPNCQSNTAGNLYLTGYDTGAGYDLATGLGSVDVANLVKFWGSATAPNSATVNASSSVSINTSSPLLVSGTVTGSAGTPTGSVTVVSFGYSSAPQNLAAGAFSITVPAASLKVGSDTITVNYSGDSKYQPASASGNVTVSGTLPSVSVNPSATSIKASDSLTITGSVTGAGQTATGTVTLSGADYAAISQPLANGSYSFTIPANSLSAGANQPLTVSYSGDTIYAAGSNSAAVTVTAAYALAASAPATVIAGGSTSSTVTISSNSGYTGTVTLSCSVSSSPSGATNLPQCTPAGTVNLTSATRSATVAMNITTTAAKAELLRPAMPGGWTRAGGGLVLAVLLFLWIPARRRNALSIFGLLLVMAALGSLVACGGGGGGGGGGGSGGTTKGIYTFTVSGTGNDTAKTTSSTTFNLTVQ